MAVRGLLAAILLAAGLVTAACSGAAVPAAVAPPEPTAAVDAERAAPAPTATPIDPRTDGRRVVVLDPGHGGDEIGAAAHGVVEKDSNLDFAFRIEALLQAEGIEVVLTRRTDTRAAEQTPGYTATRSDLQARLDLANAAVGDVFISLHSNGSTDSSYAGVEAWYDSSRDFAEEGRHLADLLVRHTLAGLRGFGYPAQDRGLLDGRCFRQREGRCFTLFVIAGPRETTREEIIRRGGDPEALGFAGRDVIYSRPANMPAALLELLVITNPADAAVLRNDAARDVIARSVADAIIEFLDTLPA